MSILSRCCGCDVDGMTDTFWFHSVIASHIHTGQLIIQSSTNWQSCWKVSIEPKAHIWANFDDSFSLHRYGTVNLPHWSQPPLLCNASHNPAGASLPFSFCNLAFVLGPRDALVCKCVDHNILIMMMLIAVIWS